MLIEHLPEALNVQDAHHNDGVLCDDVRTFLIADEIPGSKGLPAVVIRAEGESQDLKATSLKDVMYDVTIGLCVTDTNHERANSKKFRTLRAIENVLESKARQSGIIQDYQTTGKDYQAQLFTVEEPNSTEKGGTISAIVTERVTAYTEGQV